MTDYQDVISRIKKIYESSTVEQQSILKQILHEIATDGYSKTYEDVWLADYKEIPVDKATFLTDPYYLGLTNDNGESIYPAWWDMMMELEETGNQYYEIVLTGATRTGKSSTAVSDAAYNLYKLMCLRDPAKYFGLKSVTTILIFFFNLNEKLAKGVAFKEFNNTLRLSPYFNEHGSFTPSKENPVFIPEGGFIQIKYGSSSSHALGAATFLCVFDEVNFSAANVKDINKAKIDMKAKYDTIVARVTGTFVKNGEVFGKIYVISSKNSDSDFMEDYVQKQKEAGNPHMYVFDKPQWEVWPKSKYSSDRTFKIAIGGTKLKSFVVEDNISEEGLNELIVQGYRLLDVPEDNKVRFLSDFDIALRDIAGISVPGMMSYIVQEVLDGCIGDRKNPFINPILQIGVKDTLTIEEFFHLEYVDPKLVKLPMYIHLDLSLNTDLTGISGVVVSGRKDIETEDGKKLSVPTFSHIFSVSLEAPRTDKIPYDKILKFIVWLRYKGFNIQKVTRDQFQSEYIGQLLEGQGFESPKISLDRTPDGYMTLRSILMEKRIDMLHQEKLEDELVHLQRDPVSGKIDHTIGQSKDVSDSFAGAVWQAMIDNPHVNIPITNTNVMSAIRDVNNMSNTGLPSVFTDVRYNNRRR